jgi:hypothetical protein
MFLKWVTIDKIVFSLPGIFLKQMIPLKCEKFIKIVRFSSSKLKDTKINNQSDSLDLIN